MTKLKTQAAKESLLRRMRRQRLRSITVLPSLITLLNGVCGFAAIAFASNPTSFNGQMTNFAAAGYMVLLAMIADMLDGRIARMSKSTSSFGGQLDSLCDIISFGIAPAFIMFKMLDIKLNVFNDINPALSNLLHHFVWLAAVVYISCAAIRLARFNVENEEDESAHMSFIGLPTPAAAGVTVSLVIFHQEILPKLLENHSGIYDVCDNIIISALPILLFFTAILMVSRIRYPHIVNQYIKGRKPFAHLIRIILAIGLILWGREIALVVVFCGFAATGFVKWIYNKMSRDKSTVPENQNGESVTSATPQILQ